MFIKEKKKKIHSNNTKFPTCQDKKVYFDCYVWIFTLYVKPDVQVSVPDLMEERIPKNVFLLCT